MKQKIRKFLSVRTNQILVGILVLIILGLGFGIYKFITRPMPELPIQEVDLPFDPEGSYAILEPRRDGNAANLIMKRVGGYEQFSYQLVYSSLLSEIENFAAEGGEGTVDRAAGDLNSFINLEGKSEYQQEILFGTCSQGFTSGTAHCVFDQGVENGTLTLRMQKPVKRGDKVRTVYKMMVTWHLQKPDVALGKITSVDAHFMYETKATGSELSNVAYTLVSDLTAAPKLPSDKSVLGKVYAFNVPTAKTFPKGDVTIELIDNPPADAKIARFVEKDNSWQVLETQADGAKLKASAEGAGIFTVLIDKK